MGNGGGCGAGRMWSSSASRCGVAVVNRPPRIIETSPQLRSTYHSGGDCSGLNTAFSVLIEDVDDDSIRSLWLIDQGVSSRLFMTTEEGGLPLPRIRQPNSLRLLADPGNLTAGLHLLTVYVADTEFNEFVDGPFTFVLDVEPARSGQREACISAS